MKVTYKTLMYHIKESDIKYFVDMDRLTKGIFQTERPTHLPATLSKERLYEDWLEYLIMNGAKKMDLQRFEKNWNLCTLHTIELTILD